MLFHCYGLPSPRTLVQASSEVRDIMDLSIISHFWVNVLLIYILIYLINFGEANLFKIAIFTVVGFSFTMYATCW